MRSHLYPRVCLWPKVPTVPQVYFTLAIISFLCGNLLACGPGPTGRNTRSRTPMKFRQRIPDVEETSIQASGEYVGRVKRSELEENFNPDIVFKNDEKNEDDRRMTKVTAIAILDYLKIIGLNPEVKSIKRYGFSTHTWITCFIYGHTWTNSPYSGCYSHAILTVKC